MFTSDPTTVTIFVETSQGNRSECQITFTVLPERHSELQLNLEIYLAKIKELTLLIDKLKKILALRSRAKESNAKKECTKDQTISDKKNVTQNDAPVPPLNLGLTSVGKANPDTEHLSKLTTLTSLLKHTISNLTATPDINRDTQVSSKIYRNFF